MDAGGSSPRVKDYGFSLNNGVWMPGLAFGTWMVRGEEAGWALEAGYRHVDTAHMYGNERPIGAVVADWTKKEKTKKKAEEDDHKDHAFLTTKFTGHGYDHALKCCAVALEKLQRDSIDLFLIHWPGQGDAQERSETWRGMEQLYREGKCRAIGVSNYTERHLKQLLANADVVPAVNETDLVDFCNKRGIQVLSYMPLGAGNLCNHKDIKPIAAKYGKTVSQVILRWHVQHGVAPIPKSSHRERIIENSQIFDFELTEEEMRAIDGLHKGKRYDWDPTNIP